jgi:hypothetical protein
MQDDYVGNTGIGRNMLKEFFQRPDAACGCTNAGDKKTVCFFCTFKSEDLFVSITLYYGP